MALGDLMVSRFSQSSVTVVTNHRYDDDCSSSHDDNRMSIIASPRIDDEDDDVTTDNNSYGNVTSMAYVPQTIVLSELRHDAFESATSSGTSDITVQAPRWRLKERMKTGCVALVMCLNIGVDPPDVIKISPCARMECWIDPFSMFPTRALEAIGQNLSIQYERWLPRARYKMELDPTKDDVRKLCLSCRKNAKNERVLFHYNGHGVPKPTPNGEIWVFNKNFTQYIPLPVNELDSWLKTPSIYVFDCSAARLIVNAFVELYNLASSSSSGPPKDCILLAACDVHETLPQSVEFPADVFTSCLTTPIKMALKWFCRRSLLKEFIDESLIDKIPGRQNDRRTLLGELNWIFTAVTDTIAWNVLPRELFQRLFRQDLLVASLFRNFLLAERIMRSGNCTPISHPMLPPTHQHHMWDAWDMAAEICLSQLPQLFLDPNAEFQPSSFFTEQLTAFEVWLDHGSEHKKPPEQLPIVLQVLLSQSHRFRALVLLGRFLDMGPWAVDLALSVGIFPYVVKLLQTTTIELRQILVFIWTKILALDKSCQVDLVKEKEGGYRYFIKFLDSPDAFPEQRAMAAFVLAVIVDGHKRGQESCLEADLIGVCLGHLEATQLCDDPPPPEPLFLQWLCLCLGKLWEDFTEAQITGRESNAYEKLIPLLSEAQPEVRASAVFALGTLLDVGFNSRKGVSDEEFDDDEKFIVEDIIIKSLLDVVSDGSPLVRAEVAVALARFAFGRKRHLKSVAASYWKTHTNSLRTSFPSMAKFHDAETSSSTIVSSSHMGSLTRYTTDSQPVARNSSSSPHGSSSGLMQGSPLSDDSSSLHSDSGIMNDGSVISNGAVHRRRRSLDNAIYSQCVLAMFTLAKDPSPRIASLGRRVLSIIGIEQVLAKPSKSSNREAVSASASASHTPLAGLVRSSSWFDMHTGNLPLTFRTPPVSPPPRTSYLGGPTLRRVSSLEFRPHLLSSPDSSSGLADPLLGIKEPDPSLLPQSTIYKWSCTHFAKPLLGGGGTDVNEEIAAQREQKEKFALEHIAECQHSSISGLNNIPIANWDTKFEMGTKTALLHPFSPIVVAADENERIRVWNYEEATLLNGFENHDFPEKGISKLCFINELDDSLLLVASCDGSIRIWKDYATKGKQKLVTGFFSIQGHKPGARSLNAVVDWQQQSGYLYASGESSSIMLWDLEKEQLVKSSSSESECNLTALSASQVHGGQLTAGFADGSVRLYDARTPEWLVCATRPHQKVEKVVGLSFQPGLDPVKIVSASQAGDIQFLDLRRTKETYLTIDAHRGSLTALGVHRHAPIIASGSAKQLIKVFSLKGEQIGIIKYQTSFMAQKIGPVSCLNFHPYQVLLSAGAGGSFVSLYTHHNNNTQPPPR